MEEERKTTTVRLSREYARREFIRAVSNEEAMETVLTIKDMLEPVYDNHKNGQYLGQDEFDSLLGMIGLDTGDYHPVDVFTSVSNQRNEMDLNRLT